MEEKNVETSSPWEMIKSARSAGETEGGKIKEENALKGEMAGGPGGPGGPGVKTKNTSVQKAAIFVAVATSLTTTFMGSATNLAIPNISGEFAVGAAVIGWIVTAYMIPVATLTVPFGRMADLYGRKKVLVLGIGIFCIGSIISIFAPNFPVLLASRVIQAVGASMIFATNHAILVAEFPPWQRGKALGYALGATYVGLSLGPVLGGLINAWFGWRHIFTAALIVGIVSIVSAIKLLPARPSEEEGSFDVKGNILYVLMIVLIIFGLADFSLHIVSIVLVPVGLVIGYFFVKYELKQEAPMVDVRLFAENKAYSFSNLAALLNYAATFAISYLMSIYLQMVAGYSSQTAGLILIAQPLVMAVLTPRMGSLSDRISPHKLASLGMAFCAAALVILAFLKVDTPLWMIIGILVLTGIGFGIFSSPNTNAVMGCVPKSSFGVASSVLSTMRNIGQSTSMVILTIIISATMGNVALANADPAHLVSMMRTAYLIFALICVAGIYCSLQRRKL